jgi:hypothetical protein
LAGNVSHKTTMRISGIFTSCTSMDENISWMVCPPVNLFERGNRKIIVVLYQKGAPECMSRHRTMSSSNTSAVGSAVGSGVAYMMWHTEKGYWCPLKSIPQPPPHCRCHRRAATSAVLSPSRRRHRRCRRSRCLHFHRHCCRCHRRCFRRHCCRRF